MNTPTARVRRVLLTKRSIIAESFVVVRHTVHDLRERNLLRRLLVATLLALFVVQVTWRLIGTDTFGDERSVAHTVAMGVRLLAIFELQYVVSAVLFRRWSRNLPDGPVLSRSLGREMAIAAPGLALLAALQAILDRQVDTTAWATALQYCVSFAFSFVVYYAVPAAAVYQCGVFRAIQRSYVAFRATFGTDLLAWSGMWIISGIAALISIVPESFDLYQTPTRGSQRLSVVGRVFNWVALLPVTMVSQAIAAAFVTVIFYAFERNEAPAGYPTHAVETVSGLQLER